MSLDRFTANDILPVKDPTKVAPASIDIDEQLQLLGHNLEVIAELIAQAGHIVVNAKYEVAKRSAQKTKELTDDDLRTYGIVKSDKFKLVAYLLADVYRDYEHAKIESQRWVRLYDTYTEWTNIYKKLRTLGAL